MSEGAGMRQIGLVMLLLLGLGATGCDLIDTKYPESPYKYGDRVVTLLGREGIITNGDYWSSVNDWSYTIKFDEDDSGFSYGKNLRRASLKESGQHDPQ